MRIGIFVSIALVMVIAVVVLLAARSGADAPTSNSSPANLALMKFDGASPLYESTNAGADATPIYRELFELYQRHSAVLDSDPPYPAAITSQVIELLINAMNAGSVSNGFLDEQVPMRPLAGPEFGAAIESVTIVALDHAAELYDRGDGAAADVTVRAVFALGHRAFERNVRLYPRWTGLQAMLNACANLAEEGTTIEPWIKGLEKIEVAWDRKQRWLSLVRPHIGDLIRVARQDEDVTFRVRATLLLGYVKFAPGHRGNERAILDAIAELESDKQDLVRQAAEAAERFERHEIQMSR